MINISKKKDCCGCNACGDVCPKHSITFKIDKEGFWYPEVEMDTCIDCHLCEKVCPLLNKEEYKNIDGYVKPKTYALVHKNIEVRFDSTSGGAFTALAEEVYKQGGFVGGAIYNEDWSVSQFLSSSKNDLPKLRSMKCEYTAEIYRALTKEEILNRYRNDPDYHSGKKNFALYEYWHLFNMVKDPKELEELYRRAYHYSQELTGGKPWVLAANNLAVAYLKRDTVDTEVLKPLIDFSVRGCNVERTFDGRVIGIDNVEEVVANQLAMYLKKGDFSEASRLAQLLPDNEKNKKIKAFAFCLGGYYKVTSGLNDAEIARRLETFELVKNSSPLNNVVMCLAMKTHAWNEKAEKALEDLPADDPKTMYLKAVLYCRKGDFYAMQAEEALTNCFKKDSSYISIAEWDGDISEDCFKYAKMGYEDAMTTGGNE